MLPPLMVSKWFKQRNKVDLPEPDEPIIATTSDWRTCKFTSLSTSKVPNDLRMCCASIIKSVFVDGIAFLHVLEHPSQNQSHDEVKSGGGDEWGHVEIALHNVACGAQ